MHRFVEFLVGLLFGFGLILSGMSDPGKVLGFLDVAGAWDPSLLFVMGGAVGVSVFAFAIARRRTRRARWTRHGQPPAHPLRGGEGEHVVAGAVRRGRVCRYRAGAGAGLRAACRHRLDCQEHLRNQR